MRLGILTLLFSMLCVSNGAAEIVRKTIIVRGQDYTYDMFYDGDKEISTQKNGSQGSYDQKGKIPDGKVKFTDQYQKTTGEEYYKNGKKHGLSRTYYENGQVMTESSYSSGKLLTQKEYYKNAQLRTDIDYRNASDLWPGEHERGAGKMYFRNGTVKYEWNFNFDRTQGYQKAYTKSGELRFEAYFDKQGNKLER